MKNQNEQNTGFSGFKPRYNKDFLALPFALFKYLHTLSGSECLVLLYILRATLGYQKTSDKISLGQIQNGNTESNLGTGLSNSQIRRGLVSLEQKGFIKVERHFRSPSIIHLVLEAEQEAGEKYEASATASEEITRLIRLFVSVSPHRVEEFVKQKKQIEAMQKLVDTFGVGMVEEAISLIPTTNGKQYAPTIDSPYDLSEKITKLISYVHKQRDEAESNRLKVQF